MSTQSNTWAVVLAAGEGSRLHSLTTDDAGRATPKQYCSLFGGSTLLHDALRRGHAVVGRDRLCAIVAAHHEQWWRGALWGLKAGNVVSQPGNRGTANGVLLSLLTILARDPLARVLFLPADHFVENEERLALAMRKATAGLESAPSDLFLVGIEPDEADAELGYIVPEDGGLGARRVVRFVEKPSVDVAEELLGRGALWNSFIFAAVGTTLLASFRERMPDVVDTMETAIARLGHPTAAGNELEAVYASLPEVDFSRHILAGAEAQLRVVTAQACGWTDLGTPRRVGEAVRRVASRSGRVSTLRRPARTQTVNLAAALLSSPLAG